MKLHNSEVIFLCTNNKTQNSKLASIYRIEYYPNQIFCFSSIDTNDQADIIRMMDESNGVSKVRERKNTKARSKSRTAPELLKPLLENEQFSSLAAAI